jgi:gliding motility-associated-like protein
VDPLPVVVFPKDSLPWCPDEELILAPASDASTFLWSNGLSSAAIQVDQPGTYAVTGSLGSCSATDDVLVFEDPACFCRPIIPNAFTPNGDGLNDVWRLINVGDCPDTDRFMLLLYNRWGELLWESSDIHAGWDGTWRGRLAETGAYLYKIRLQLPDEGEVLWQGNVTLVR